MKISTRLILLFLLFIGVILAGLSIGAVTIPFPKVLNILFTRGTGIQYEIIHQVRLPRILLAITVGGGLSLAGVLFQALFRNPLVEPYTLGVSGGAALGVSINHALLGVTGFTLSLPLSGFAGSLVIIAVLFLLGFRKGHLRLNNILLTGVMISFISSALVMFIMSVSGRNTTHQIVFWIMGSLDRVNLPLIRLVLWITLAILASMIFLAVRLNAIILGEEAAANLGVRVESLKKLIFLLASLLTGCGVSVAGIIGFVGLVVPHFVRLYLSRDHRILPFASFITGGLFLIVSDTLARTVIAPVELPVGVITGILGGILFVYALNKQHLLV